MSQTLTAAPVTSAQPTERPSAWSALLAGAKARHAERVAVRRLRAELASYDNPAAIEELLAMAESHDGPDAERVRTILLDNLSDYRRRTAQI